MWPISWSGTSSLCTKTFPKCKTMNTLSLKCSMAPTGTPSGSKFLSTMTSAGELSSGPWKSSSQLTKMQHTVSSFTSLPEFSTKVVTSISTFPLPNSGKILTELTKKMPWWQKNSSSEQMCSKRMNRSSSNCRSMKYCSASKISEAFTPCSCKECKTV